MKATLLLLFLASALNLNAQSTWTERLYYWPHDAYYVYDSACGVQSCAVGADGNLYLLGKTVQNETFYIFKISPNGGSFLSMTQVGTHWTLQEDVPGALHATADSGSILFINHNSWVDIGHTDARIEKYSVTGTLQWTTNFYHNDALLVPDIRCAYDLIESSSGDYYVFIRDSLFVLDNSGAIISGTDAVSGKQMFELSNGDLLVRKDNSVIRTDLSGNISWTYSAVNPTDVVCFSPSAAFICEQGVQVTKIDASNGSVVWSAPISPSPISSIDATSDGGVIIANGMQVRFSANQAMNGTITKFDASGNQEWSKTYNFPHYGLSCVTQLPSGNYLTGGTYIAHDNWGCSFDYNGFSAVVDSSGSGPLETDSYLWPGDVDVNDTLDFATDGLLIGIAFGASGPPRDHDNFPVYIDDMTFYVNDYGSDWSQNFGNGINYKHADHNGDGTIDTNDLHNYFIGYGEPYPINCKESDASQENTLPDFQLIPQSSTVLPGDTMRFYVVAGSAGTPVNSLYDIASVLWFDGSMVDNSFVKVSAVESDFGTPGDDEFEYSDTYWTYAGIMAMLFSRSDHNNVLQLHDTLGVIELVADPNISAPTLFNLGISRFGAATYNTSPVAFNTIGGSVLIDPTATSVQGVEDELVIYPNPASQNLTVKTFYTGEKRFEIVDMPGRTLMTLESSASVVHIPTSDLETGTYFIRVSSGGNEKVSKFVVEH